MKTEQISIGLRVFNRGDMCNPEHWGTITRIKKSLRWHDSVEITPDAEAEREPYFIPAAMIEEVDKGNGSTRVVTEAAYNKLREERISSMVSEYKRIMNRIKKEQEAQV